nr:NADH dehydrogenase subunit 6 [Apis florea]
MKMIPIYISKLMFSMLLMLLMTIFLNKLYNNPMMLLIFLIMYSIFISISLYIICPMNSLLIFMTLIVFISGMLILFSYFISLLNKPIKIKIKFIILSIMSTLLINKLLKKYFINNLYTSLMFKNLNLMSSLYMNPNIIIFMLMIFMLIITLLLMTKISFIEKKTLRQKK